MVSVCREEENVCRAKPKQSNGWRGVAPDTVVPRVRPPGNGSDDGLLGNSSDSRDGPIGGELLPVASALRPVAEHRSGSAAAQSARPVPDGLVSACRYTTRIAGEGARL
jgi:hypothetical protein